MWWLLCAVALQAPPGATVAGVVVSAAGGAAMPRVAVTLSTTGAKPMDAVALTDARGAFQFNYVPAGRYEIYASKTGYQPPRPVPALVLGDGEVRRLTLRLEPLGSVSGAVTDQQGQPVAGAQVQLLRQRWERRKPVFAPVQGTNAGSRGEYHISRVPPGRYIVMASNWYGPAVVVHPEGTPMEPSADPMYGVSYYPDAARTPAAGTLEVAPGQDIAGIDLRLPLRARVALRLKATVPEDVPYVMVHLLPQDVPGFNTVSSLGLPAPKYEAEAPNLAPGRYLAVAFCQNGGHTYRGTERFEAGAPGVEEVTIRLERGIEIAGRLVVEGDPRVNYESYRVALVPGDGLPFQGPEPEARVKRDGTFRIAGVVAGVWDISVQPIPEGGYIKAMRLGDEDVLTEDMTIGPDTAAPLNIVLSTRGASLQGKVVAGEDVPAAGATVVLAPVGRFEHVVSFYRTARTDETGRYEMKALTPGKYRLYALDDFDRDRIQDPGLLAPFASRGEPVELGDAGKVTRDLRLIPAGGPAR